MRRLVVSDHDIRKKLGPNYSTRGIKWDPTSFVVESPKLKTRIIEADLQETGLLTFEGNPKQPMTYIVAGNPDDREAWYFAHYLMQVHKMAVPVSDIQCVPVLGDFDPMLSPESRPTMLVLSNLTTKSSNLKYSKVADTIAKHRNIPVVLVVAGEDPISFAATRLHLPCHAIAYFASKIMADVQEIL
jgi:hypothetical protein